MKLTNPWLGYLDRSYQQIKASVTAKMAINAPEITDYSEGNILMKLVGIFAAIGEVLNVYVDNMAREVFLTSCRKYTSALAIVKMIDYRIGVTSAPSANLLFTLMFDGEPTAHVDSIIIPVGTQVMSSSNGISFFTATEVTLLPGYTHIVIPAINQVSVPGEFLGNSTGLADQTIALPLDYVGNSMVIEIDALTWSEYDSFAYMGPGTRGFIVDCLEDGNPYIIFGNGVNGAIPTSGSPIYGSYYTSAGANGNLPPSTITTLVSSISLPTGYTFTITNQDYSSGGTGIQTLAEIKRKAPISLRTLNRAVTYKDYKDLTLLAPGVGDAVVDYCCCCATAIQIYIASTTRGIATTLLLNSTKAFLESRKIVGRKLYVKPAGITRLYLDLGVTAYPGFDIISEVPAEVLRVLNLNYGYNGSMTGINTTIQPSQIIALLSNISSVYGVSINRVYLQPYCRPFGYNTMALDITWDETQGVRSTIKIVYKLHYNLSTNNFFLYKNGLYYATIAMSTPYSDGTIFYIDSINDTGFYEDNMEWEFTIYPSYAEVFSNFSLPVDDNSQPIVDVDFTDITDGVPAFFGRLTVTSLTTNDSDCVTC